MDLKSEISVDVNDNSMGLSQYDLWERQLTDQVIILLQCTNSDAQGFVEAAIVKVKKAFDHSLTARKTAEMLCAIETIEVKSSQGTLRVNRETGDVIHCDMDEDAHFYKDIDKIDIKEWKKRNPNKNLEDGILLLDVGVWMKGGNYVGPTLENKKLVSKI